jgi:hypothetical protein
MKRIFLAATITAATITTPTTAHAAKNPCNKYSGRSYIICKESGPQHMPHGLPAGTPHNPRLSTAAGPCGLLKANQRRYGGSGHAACNRYMADRYGSWQRAEQFHRSRNWW